MPFHIPRRQRLIKEYGGCGVCSAGWTSAGEWWGLRFSSAFHPGRNEDGVQWGFSLHSLHGETPRVHSSSVRPRTVLRRMCKATALRPIGMCCVQDPNWKSYQGLPMKISVPFGCKYKYWTLKLRLQILIHTRRTKKIVKKIVKIVESAWITRRAQLSTTPPKSQTI